MITPKSLVTQLGKHWDIIESLCRASRDLPAFEESQVLGVINKLNPQASQEEHHGILRSLIQADLLQSLSRTQLLQINPLVLDFVRGLTREHELGLSSVLKARVDAIQQATEQLSNGINASDAGLMHQGAKRLSELFRQISQQLDQDRHAILELAEQAKASDTSIPIDKRYQAVLDAYDHYIEPMNDMMDSGPGGSFYPFLEKSEQMLDKANEVLSVQGALYTHRLFMRQAGYQAKELRRLGRVVAKQCVDTLLPLREEARQHSQLTTAISYLLGHIRKQGLTRGLKPVSKRRHLPLWQRERRSRISVGDEIRNLMAEAQHFTPEITRFPEELSGTSVDMSALVDEQQLQHELAQSLPVDNLMLWLIQHYPQLPDSSVLRLYHDLLREPLWQITQNTQETETELKTLKVRYYPHRLLLLSQELTQELTQELAQKPTQDSYHA